MVVSSREAAMQPSSGDPPSHMPTKAATERAACVAKKTHFFQQKKNSNSKRVLHDVHFDFWRQIFVATVLHHEIGLLLFRIERRRGCHLLQRRSKDGAVSFGCRLIGRLLVSPGSANRPIHQSKLSEFRLLVQPGWP